MLLQARFSTLLMPSMVGPNPPRYRALARGTRFCCAIKKQSRSGRAKLCRSLEPRLADRLTCIPIKDVNPLGHAGHPQRIPNTNVKAHPHSGFQDNIITHFVFAKGSGPQSFLHQAVQSCKLYGDFFWRTFGADEQIFRMHTEDQLPISPGTWLRHGQPLRP